MERVSMKRIGKLAGMGILGCCMAGGVISCGRTADMSSSAVNLTKQYQTEETEPVSAELGADFKTSYTDFSIQLLRESRKASGETEDGETGTMVSPLSAVLALEMTRTGAEGETLAQMGETLYPGISTQQGKEGLLAFRQELSERQEGELNLANSIWFRNGDYVFTPEEEFLKTNAREFGAEIYQAPFDETTLKDINEWVEDETDGMVKDILDEIPKEGVMYLVNAVAFNGQWQEPYDTAQVHEVEFCCADGNRQNVSMMLSEESLYLEDNYAEGFLKPYEDGYSFAALVPKDDMTLDEYISQMDGETFLNTIEQAEYYQVTAGLPKFAADTSLELSDILKTMGMPLAFDEDNANFSGIGSTENGNIYIARVLHKTYIEVDEQGTEAGASTVVEMAQETSAEADEQKMKTVILDRPFLYAIVDDTTNLPVFIGTVEKLSSESGN